jgi:hypothetical protein
MVDGAQISAGWANGSGASDTQLANTFIVQPGLAYTPLAGTVIFSWFELR